MIGRVAGRIVHRGADHVVIDAGGIGYVVHVSERTLAGLPAAGQAAALWTDLLVREDLLQLFGFPSLLEKEWHRLLMSVQGIGARASMAMLGALGAEGVGRAIAMGDARSIQTAPGVGPKIAQRVVLELKAKAPAMMAMGLPGEGVVEPVHSGAAPVIEPASSMPAYAPSAQADALSALSNLGYGPGDAAGAVARAAGESPDADAAALIRAALRALAPKG
jgi:Holliday junction DNA helicase RuvA